MCDSETSCACSTAEPGSGSPAATAGGVQAVYSVTGMTCGGCATRVREEVAAVPGVGYVSVDVRAGTITVTGGEGVDDAAVDAAVTRAGYQLVR
jgi:copper chaperone CopZ